jgi:AcrR family transcriptional regulator
MTRLPKDRDTQLSKDEIVGEALREFDQGRREPSIRSLAASLQVAPSAIYHHFGSRAEIVRAAVDVVWSESLAELMRLVPDPLEAEPREVLVAVGLATRRAWLTHHNLAPYLAANPEVDDFTRNALDLMANLLERLGLTGEAAAEAFHAYTSFMIGSVLFAASRLVANEELEVRKGDRRATPFVVDYPPGVDRRSSDETRRAFDTMMDLSKVDPDGDEALYIKGLGRLVDSLIAND